MINQLDEEKRVLTDVTSLKDIFNAGIPQEEETESHVDGVHYAEMKDSPLIDCTEVDGDSDFDIINNKARRREAKEQTQLRDDKDTKRTMRRFPYYENCPMYIESPDRDFSACLQSIGTVIFLDIWFPTQGDLESIHTLS